MMQRMARIPIGLVFLAVLCFDAYLLFSVLDGAQVIRHVEAAAGRSLSCYELYDDRTVDTYFYPQHRMRGETIYLFSALLPLWLIVSVGSAVGLRSVVTGTQRWRRAPSFIMGAVMFLVVLCLPIIGKISCAIE